MTDTTELENALQRAAEQLRQTSVASLFDSETDRASVFRCEIGDLTLDFSRQRLDGATLATLCNLAAERGLGADFNRLIGGEALNVTEGRPALHTLLRGTGSNQLAAESGEVAATLDRMRHLTEAVRSGAHLGHNGDAISDVVNIGIGGSDLGPRMVCRALRQAGSQPKVHFVANVDPQDLDEVLAALNPATTLFIVCSKSFTTEETLTNALRARAWLFEAGVAPEDVAKHVVAVTTNLEAAEAFGIDRDQCYPMWDWVGGRYSLWSAIGLSIAMQLGWTGFTDLLAGARSMDSHAASAQPAANLPMLMALLEYWNCLYLGTDTHVVLPYAQRLEKLAEFLQQLTMESNGKRVTNAGSAVAQSTAPVLWGSAGTIGQHSYYQLLHQGNRSFSADILLPLRNGDVDGDAHRKLAANALAQSRAFMVGRSPQEATALAESRGQPAAMTTHYEMPGNHPHSLILMTSVSLASLGALIAAYEHKTFFLARLMDINPFDQWGVELGKVIGRQVGEMLATGEGLEQVDPAMAMAIEAWRDANPDR